MADTGDTGDTGDKGDKGDKGVAIKGSGVFMTSGRISC